MQAWGDGRYGQTTVPHVPPKRILTFSAGGANGAIILGNPDEEKFHAWRVRHRVGLHEPFNKDSDADGLTLVEEYAFGCNPKVSDRANAVTVSESVEDGVVFSYRLLTKAVDIVAQFEISSDLENWTKVDSEDMGREGKCRLFRYRAGAIPKKVFGRLRLSLY